MKKKLLLILLTFSMLLPLFSGMTFTAVATSNVARIERTGTEYESLSAAVSAASGGDTITLLANVTDENTVTINKDITVNGAGKTFTYTGTNRAFTISANVTVKNMTVLSASGGGFVVAAGSLALGERDVKASAVTVNTPGTADANVPLRTGNDNITVNLYYANLTGSIGLIRLYSDQYKLNIYDGEYNMTCNDSSISADCRLLQENSAVSSAQNPVREVNIYGGAFNSHQGYVFLLTAPDIVLNVYNGYFNHTGTGIRYIFVRSNAELNIFGGFFNLPNMAITIDVDSEEGKITAYGGTVVCEGSLNGSSYDAMLPVSAAAVAPRPKVYGLTSIHSESFSDVDEIYFRPFMRPVLTTGAAVSLDPDVPGIKFFATMPEHALRNVNDVKDDGSAVSYGMLVAPLLNLEEFPVLNFDTVNCLGLVEGEDYVNLTASETGVNEYGDITFATQLTGIDEKYFGLDYTANAYVKFKVDGHDVYVFSNYSEANTRNMKDIATRALADHDEHNREYTDEELQALENYAGAEYVDDASYVSTILCLNVLAIMAGDGYTYYDGQSGDDYTFEKRLGYIREAIRYADPDVMLFQEWSKAQGWASVVTLNGQDGRYTSPQFPGYEWISHMNRSGVAYENYDGDDEWEMFNFVVYDTEKYDYISSGTRFVSKSGELTAQPQDLLRNRESGQTQYDGDLGEFTWVVLREKTTGLKAIYASTHTTQGTILNATGNARNAYMLENMQVMTGYLQTVSQANDNAPVIIGGDFNMPIYGGDLLPQYYQFTQVANYEDAKMTGSDSGTGRNLGGNTRPRMGSSDNDIRIDYIFANGAQTYGYEVLNGQVLSNGTYDPFAEIGSRFAGGGFASNSSEGYDISDHFPIVSNVIVRKAQTYEAYDVENDVYSNPNTKNDQVVENASGTGSTSTKVLLNNEAARAAVKTLASQYGAQYMKADIVNDGEKGNVLRISATDETNLVNIALNYSDLYTQSLDGYTKIKVTYKTEFTYADAKVSMRASKSTTSLSSFVASQEMTGANNGEWQTAEMTLTNSSGQLNMVGFFGNYMETGLLKGDAIYIASIELTN